MFGIGTNTQTKKMLPIIAGATFWLSSLPAISMPVTYEGNLVEGVVRTGQVGNNGWHSDVASDVDFWFFHGVAGQQYTLRADRIDPGLDTALSLYEGITASDESTFVHDADFGGLTFIDSADDEIPYAGGPYGDPLLTFTAPSTGFYTVAIGDYLGDGTGPFNYQIQLTPVPLPAAVWLFGSGLLGLVGFRRFGDHS